MLLIFLAAIAVAALRHAAPPVYTQTPITVTGGHIVGTVEGDVCTYKGIPFAAPPVGANRWRAPQPVLPWKGIRKADAYGPAPMQNKMAARMFSGSLWTQVSEDCLYLNVWQPARHAGAKMPVMVWIYGGGFRSGLTGSPLYDGTKLAQKGVIVVSVAYRVGPFGFLAHPELSRESGGQGSGDYGLMDQIAGLRWVRQNIAAFGGDPTNVTIFGESAGGESVGILAASPPARGLFGKVISQSGSFFGVARQSDQLTVGAYTLPFAETKGQDFLHRLGADDLAAARALPADTIQDALGSDKFWPVQDGYLIPGDPYRAYQAGRFNDTPILVGTNSDDGSLLGGAKLTPAQFEAYVRANFVGSADAILAAYPHATDAQTRQSSRLLVGDTLFGWGTWSWARLQTQKGKNAAYLYTFDRFSAKTPDGAAHGAEVPYVFGFAHPQFGLSRPEDVAFSDTMQRYWVNFARTRNPNGPGLTPWPAYHEPDAKALHFGNGTDISAQPVPRLKQYQILDEYYAEQRDR